MSEGKGLANQSFATKGGHDGNDSDSEEVFEEEELSSSECNSGEEDSAYNSQADPDMFSQENESMKHDRGFEEVEKSRNGIKLPPNDMSQNNDPSAAKAKAGQSGAMGDSEDSDVFDQEEQTKLNWQQIFLQERMMGEP